MAIALAHTSSHSRKFIKKEKHNIYFLFESAFTVKNFGRKFYQDLAYYPSYSIYTTDSLCTAKQNLKIKNSQKMHFLTESTLYTDVCEFDSIRVKK